MLETSFDRPNLKYEVIGKTKEPLKQLGKLLMDHFKNLCGIVYCLSKNECVEVSKFLNEKFKIKTVYYHAGLAARQRIAVQQKWRSGEAHVVCATIAFGMGIDKPDVVSLVYRTIAALFHNLHFLHSPFLFLELEFDNTGEQKMIIHVSFLMVKRVLDIFPNYASLKTCVLSQAIY